MQRNRPKQGVEGGNRRPTRNDYATVERRAPDCEFVIRKLDTGVRLCYTLAVKYVFSRYLWENLTVY